MDGNRNRRQIERYRGIVEACMNNFAICGDSRPCFAKHYNSTTHRYFCNCLSSVDVPVYKDGECPFCKPLRYMTDGKEYMTEEERRKAQLKMLDQFPKKVCQ